MMLRLEDTELDPPGELTLGLALVVKVGDIDDSSEDKLIMLLKDEEKFMGGTMVLKALDRLGLEIPMLVELEELDAELEITDDVLLDVRLDLVDDDGNGKTPGTVVVVVVYNGLPVGDVVELANDAEEPDGTSDDGTADADEALADELDVVVDEAELPPEETGGTAKLPLGLESVGINDEDADKDPTEEVAREGEDGVGIAALELFGRPPEGAADQNAIPTKTLTRRSRGWLK